MEKLDHWLKQQAHRSLQFLSIADLLFNRKQLGYLYFRLRYFYWLVALRLIFHLAIVWLLQQTLLPTHLYQVGGVWIFSLMLSSAWWGGLEVLRTRVRDFYSTKEIDALSLEISHWLIIGFGLSSLLLLGAAYQLFTGIKLWQHSQAAFNYFFNSSVLFILAGRVLIEPFHSGIYAVSRILRPIYSLLVGDAIGFGCILIGWPWLGQAILPIALLLTGLINLSLRYIYCKRMYGFYGLNLSLAKAKKNIGVFLQQLPRLDFLLASLAMLAINFESVLLLVLIAVNQDQTFFQPLLMLLFLSLPLFQASSEWAQLFYFDCKKLRRFNFEGLRAYYQQSVLHLAPFIGILLGLVVILLGKLLLVQVGMRLSSVVLVLLLARSLIAYLQIRAFANFHYLDILLSVLGMLGLLGLSYSLALEAWEAILLLLSGLVGIIVYLLKPRAMAVDRGSQFKQHLNYYDWLTQLQQATGQVQIIKITVAANTSYYKQLRIVSWLIAHFLQATDGICMIGKQIIFYRLNAPANSLIDHAALAINTGGLIKECQVSAVYPKATKQLPAELKSYLLAPKLVAVKEAPGRALKQTNFLQQFPEGMYFNPVCHLGPQAKRPEQAVIHSLLYQAELFLTGQFNEQFPYEIALEYRAGTIQVIYAVPKAHYPRALLRAWRLTVDNSNIESILQSE